MNPLDDSPATGVPEPLRPTDSPNSPTRPGSADMSHVAVTSRDGANVEASMPADRPSDGGVPDERPAWQPLPQAWQPPPGAWQAPAPGWSPSEPPRPRRLLRGVVGLLVIVIVAAGGFLAGVGYARGGLVPGTAQLSASPPADARTQVGLLYEAWNLVEQHYVDRAALNPTQLTYGAIRGLVQALGDTGHTDFLTPQESAALNSDLSGQYQGIGVEISIKTQGPSIVSVFEGSPAQKAGLRAGDLIIAVNGQDVTADSFDGLASKLRGPSGSTVRVTVLDPGASASRVVTVTRGPINVPNVSWAMVPGTHIADVQLQQFAQNAAAQLTAALKSARAAGATGIILDLRGDPGGYVSEAVGAASQFLPAGDVVFIQRDSSGKETTSKAQPGGLATTMPVVALVDNGTASAAEIVAGALQDNGRATIVGVTTFGTGTVLESFKLSDGSEVRIGVAEWLTPKGHQIWHKGIQPNDVVSLPSTASPLAPSDLSHLTAAKLAASGDTQLLRGLALLSKP
jgi:carboxyl-terminal processing protease